MVRLLLRHGVSYRDFADLARHVYVDVAEKDFPLDDKKPSNARTAVLTGINRKDIAKLKNKPHPLSSFKEQQPAPIARIITGWMNDERFSENGRAKPLTLSDKNDTAETATFAFLVKEYATDVPPRAMLDELKRIRAISVEDETVQLIVDGYVPHENLEENLRIFSTAAKDLLSTMDHNISCAPENKLIQRTVSYDDIPEELLPQIRKKCKDQGLELLLKINEWLAQCDRNENKKLEGSGKSRAGMGIYYFEQNQSEETLDDKNDTK